MGLHQVHVKLRDVLMQRPFDRTLTSRLRGQHQHRLPLILIINCVKNTSLCKHQTDRLIKTDLGCGPVTHLVGPNKKAKNTRVVPTPTQASPAEGLAG